MSHVASLELCKELERLSGWYHTTYFWDKKTKEVTKNVLCMRGTGLPEQGYSPAYDAGYLLRKFPAYLNHEGEKWYFTLCREISGELWQCGYELIQEHSLNLVSLAQAEPTPEDALCKLMIEFIKTGQLKLKGVE